METLRPTASVELVGSAKQKNDPEEINQEASAQARLPNPSALPSLGVNLGPAAYEQWHHVTYETKQAQIGEAETTWTASAALAHW